MYPAVTSFAFIFVAGLGCAVCDPKVYDLGVPESPKHCPGLKEASVDGCFLDALGDLDLDLWKCWVTSRVLCDTRTFAGAQSVCQHSTTDIVKRCVEGQWKGEDKTLMTLPRKKRAWCFLFWCETKKVKNRPPSISCPADVTKYASFGHTSARVDYRTPTASDDRGTPSVQKVSGPSSGSLFSEGSTIIRYRARDSEGATSECYFTVTIKVHYCTSVPYLAFGSSQCTGSKPNAYGSTCTHTCQTGYNLNGSSVALCTLTNARPTWNSSFPTCEPVSCGNPGSVGGASVQCANGHTYNQTCYVICRPGHEHAGSKFITCMSSGQWTQLSPCNDVQAPRFPNGCPETTSVFSGPLRAAVALTWADPVTSDNSGEAVSLSSVPTKGSLRGPGSHVVTLTARDARGNNASCSFTIDIRVRECPLLATPAHSEISCSSDNVEGSVCRISCNGGYRLQGQATLTCLSSERWDGLPPICQAIICPLPPTVDNGQFSCPDGRQNPAVCTLTCDGGYVVRGQRSIECGPTGTWSTPGRCEDVEQPVFQDGCPDNIQVDAARLGQRTNINLTSPVAVDNSGDVIEVTSDVSADEAFDAGTTVVTFTATDASGNANVCLVNVTVTVLQCPPPALQPQSSDGLNPLQETCPNGYVYGASCTLSCAQGYRLQGRPVIACERDESTHPATMLWTWDGSEATKPVCKEDNCPPLPPPVNGALSCYHGDFGWDCFLSCDASWDVPAQFEGLFACPNDRGTWFPSAMVNCTARTAPHRIKMMADLLYFTGSCNASLELLRHNFIAHINQTILAESCSQTTTCVMENIGVECGPVSSRRRRESKMDDALMLKLSSEAAHVNRVTSHVVVVTFSVTLPYEEDSTSPEEAYKKYQETSDNILSKMKTQADLGRLDLRDLDLVTDGSSLGQAVLEAECPPGTVKRVTSPQTRFSCVQQ